MNTVKIILEEETVNQIIDTLAKGDAVHIPTVGKLTTSSFYKKNTVGNEESVLNIKTSFRASFKLKEELKKKYKKIK